LLHIPGRSARQERALDRCAGPGGGDQAISLEKRTCVGIDQTPLASLFNEDGGCSAQRRREGLAVGDLAVTRIGVSSETVNVTVPL
jgi:hypothetical protein